ncbi:MAG: VRR-NUC domain-containing protein [Clostridia bacterium]|nr:VRR-NUC domain-containing protein [Clostridia bacterium]
MATRIQAGLSVPTESMEQQALFRWAALQRGKYPELALMYHIPNGGKRSKSEAVRFRLEGVRAGVPDICLPAARGEWHGLYIELKRRKGGVISGEQSAWIEALTREGYCAGVCRGWEAAAKMIIKYLTSGRNEHAGDELHHGQRRAQCDQRARMEAGAGIERCDRLPRLEEMDAIAGELGVPVVDLLADREEQKE